MRKFTLFFFLVALLFSSVTFAQSILVVEPGVGSLNAAITANGGNKIYQLKAGGWYQLDAIIEHKGYHLQIIGEKPAAGKLPPTLQTNDDTGGKVFGNMFNAFGNITIKGVYIMNVDLLGVTGGAFLTQNDSMARVVIDNCVLDPISGGNAFALNGKKSRTYFTNNLAIRMGHQLSPNDGHFFSISSAPGTGCDTLYVENNTFVCMGTNMLAADFAKVVQGYIKFNHNTWVMQKSQFDWSVWEKTFIFSNNLMFDCQTQPWAITWQPMPGADVKKPLPCLIYADTIPNEVFPSTRQQFWEYNNHYRNPKFYPMLADVNQKAVEFKKAKMYYMPILWNKDSINKSREVEMFANDVAFPNWKAGNNTENIDPQWEDPQIYVQSDKFVEWTKWATYQHGLGLASTEYPPASDWTKYYWDLDGDITINSAWPAFNGKYKNPALLTASYEKLPLGDLNWFPESKVKWEKNKTNIDAAIHAGIEKQFEIVSVRNVYNDASFVNIMPNPVSNYLKLSKVAETITILDITGRKLKELTNTDVVSVKEYIDGIYFVSYKIGSVSGTQKFIIQKKF